MPWAGSSHTLKRAQTRFPENTYYVYVTVQASTETLYKSTHSILLRKQAQQRSAQPHRAISPFQPEHVSGGGATSVYTSVCTLGSWFDENTFSRDSLKRAHGCYTSICKLFCEFQALEGVLDRSRTWESSSLLSDLSAL